MPIDVSVMIAAAVTLSGAIIMVWALLRRRQPDVTERVMVMPQLADPPRSRGRFAKGSVEFASVDAVDLRPRTLRPSHARRAV
jgi:hypothetical protein